MTEEMKKRFAQIFHMSYDNFCTKDGFDLVSFDQIIVGHEPDAMEALAKTYGSEAVDLVADLILADMEK